MSALNPLFRGKTDRALIHLLRTIPASMIAFGADLGVMVLLTEAAGLHYLASAAAGFIVGVSISYLLSIRWVFSRRSLSNPSLEYGLFLLIGVGGLGINGGTLWALTEQLHLYYVTARIAASVVGFFWNFWIRRFSLFR